MMYVVVGHNKEDLITPPRLVSIMGKDMPDRNIVTFREAVRFRRMSARKYPKYEYTIFRLTYCDQNKEE